MTTEIFYIYDTHCPWSYATLPLVNEIANSLPEIQIHLWHSARYEGDENISKQTLEQVSLDSNIKFKDNYLGMLSQAKDSTMAANLLSWVENKVPHQSLEVLNDIAKAHFESANELTELEDFEDIITKHKLSPPQKVFKLDKLSKDAEFTLHNIYEIQEVIATKAIPALLLAIDDNLILLNHNLYLSQPKAIIDAIKLEVANNK